MNYMLDLGPWGQVFAVPGALVDKHLKLAGKEQLQVILWALRHSGESFTPEHLADELGITADAALDALEYWVDRGLLASRDGLLHPLAQPEDAHVSKAAPTPAPLSSEAAPEAESKPLPPKKKLPRPDANYLVARMQESDAIRTLMQEAESLLGILSPAMSGVLLASCDDYGLPVEVVLMLIHYAKEVGKTSTAYIDSVARDWAASGVFDLQAAEEKLRELDEKRRAWGKVSGAAGLQKRSPSKKEEETAHRWVFQWKFSAEMLSAAYDRCADNTGKFSMAYMDKILADWYKKGLKTLADLEQAEQKKQQEKSASKSYDIDELERLSFFDLPEDM